MKFFAKIFEEIRMMYTVPDRRVDNHLSAKNFRALSLSRRIIPKTF